MRALAAVPLVLALGLLPSACVTEPVQPDLRLDAITTLGSLSDALEGVTRYALHPDGRVVRADAPNDPGEVRLAVESEIYNTLERAGFHLVPEAEAERYVAYAVGISGEMHDDELLELFGITPGMDVDEDTLRGGVVLAIIDPRAGSILWRGTVGAEVEERAPTRAERDRRIRAVIAALLGALPSRTGA